MATETTDSRREPIFLIGCPRSGTTLLRHILDSHDSIACPPESKFIVGLLDMLRDADTMGGLSGMGFKGPALYRILRRMLEAPFVEYASRHGKPRWADKTPNYFRAVEFIEDVFEGRVRFVFIVRHPFDCAISCEEMFRGGGLRFALADKDLAENIKKFGSDSFGFLKYWREVNERLWTYHSSNPGRSHMVKYEDLVLAPKSALTTLFAHLDERFQDGVLDRAFSGVHAQGIGDNKFRHTRGIQTSSLCRYRTWSRQKREVLWPLVADIAKQFGYTPDLNFTLQEQSSDDAGSDFGATRQLQA